MNYEKHRKPCYRVTGMIPGFLDDDDDKEEEEQVVDQIEEAEKTRKADERRVFWESQEELLQANLFRTTLFEARIGRATKDVLRKLNSDGGGGGVRCSCTRRVVSVGCRSCCLKEVSVQLQNSGFDCVICYSNWKSSPKIPAGRHTYLEVTETRTKGSEKLGETKKVIIELNFREEFEMARANQEYSHIITKLPEVFVGKAERLRDLVRILCTCSKKSMKESKMHLAPWRKCGYMQAKWRGKPLEQAAAAAAAPPPPVAAMVVEPPKGPPRQRASMDLHIRRQNNKAVPVKVV